MLVPIPELQHGDHSTVSWIKIAEADQEGDEDRTPMLISRLLRQRSYVLLTKRRRWRLLILRASCL